MCLAVNGMAHHNYAKNKSRAPQSAIFARDGTAINGMEPQTATILLTISYKCERKQYATSNIKS
jgi:hypothetical protein